MMEVSGDVTMAENFCAIALYGKWLLPRISNNNSICGSSFMNIIIHIGQSQTE